VVVVGGGGFGWWWGFFCVWGVFWFGKGAFRGDVNVIDFIHYKESECVRGKRSLEKTHYKKIIRTLPKLGRGK